MRMIAYKSAVFSFWHVLIRFGFPLMMQFYGFISCCTHCFIFFIIIFIALFFFAL